MTVVKVGGSLLDWDGLPQALTDWLARCPDRVLLVIGGGRAAELVRQWANLYALDDETAHWLAIDAMRFNARLMAALLADRVSYLDAWGALLEWQSTPVPAGGVGSLDRRRAAIFEPSAWLRTAGRGLPFAWHVTSDSIAAWLARNLNLSNLTLVKSVGDATGCDVATAVEHGWIDSHFPVAATGLTVDWVNLRAGTAFRMAKPTA